MPVAQSYQPTYTPAANQAQLDADWKEGLITLDMKDMDITNVLRMLSYRRI